MKQTEKSTKKKVLVDLLNDEEKTKAITGWGTLISSVAMITGLGHANDVGFQDPTYLPFLIGGVAGAIGTVVMGAGRAYYHINDNRTYNAFDSSEQNSKKNHSLMERYSRDMFPLDSGINDPIKEEIHESFATDIKHFVQRYR